MKLKKKKGSIAKFGIPLFTIVAVFSIVVMLVTYLSDVDKKDSVDIIAREYLLKMETEGFLNSTDETELYKDLAKIGVKNVSLTGTTRAKVGYGKKINLVIKGQVEVTSYSIENMFKITKVPKLINTGVNKSSTAKY